MSPTIIQETHQTGIQKIHHTTARVQALVARATQVMTAAQTAVLHQGAIPRAMAKRQTGTPRNRHPSPLWSHPQVVLTLRTKIKTMEVMMGWELLLLLKANL
jgi:hypothetical protein